MCDSRTAPTNVNRGRQGDKSRISPAKEVDSSLTELNRRGRRSASSFLTVFFRFFIFSNGCTQRRRHSVEGMRGTEASASTDPSQPGKALSARKEPTMMTRKKNVVSRLEIAPCASFNSSLRASSGKRDDPTRCCWAPHPIVRRPLVELPGGSRLHEEQEQENDETRLEPPATSNLAHPIIFHESVVPPAQPTRACG